MQLTKSSTQTLQSGTISNLDRLRIINRISRDHKVSLQYSERIFNETCLFLSLSASFRGNNFAPSKDVDAGWHTFILYTKAYVNYCRSLGVKYIHHEPNDNPNDHKSGGLLSTIRFMRNNNINFDEELWITNKLKTMLLLNEDCDADPGECTGCSAYDCNSE